MNNSSTIIKKQADIKADIKDLLAQLKVIGNEINALTIEWDSSDRKTGDTRITGAYIQFNELLNQIHAKKQELRILKGDAQPGRVPVWKGHQEEIGLECF